MHLRLEALAGDARARARAQGSRGLGRNQSQQWHGFATIVKCPCVIAQGAAFDGNRLSALDQEAPVSRTLAPMALAWIPKDAEFPYSRRVVRLALAVVNALAIGLACKLSRAC